MNRFHSLPIIRLRSALRRAEWVFEVGIPGSTVTYAYTPDSLDAGYSVLTPSNAVLTRTLTRDPQRRGLILSVSNLVNGVDSGSSFDYAYDALGRPVTRNLDEFGYNARGEVAWARYGTNTLADIYHYDFIGNFTSNRLRGAWSQFAANELNEYTFVAASNPRQLAYDLDGNLLTNGVWSYVYDSLNRLSEIVFNGELALQISYDTRSRCIKRLMPQGDYYYFYDDRNIIYENEMSVGGNSELYYGKDIRGALHQFGNVGGILSIQTSHHAYMFYDAHGNIVEMNDSIGPESFFNYDVFGNSMNSVGISSRPTQFGYSSKELLKIANLYDYGHRFYTAELGRWTSRDPLGEAVSLNRYTFVRNNPNIFFDAYGLEQIPSFDFDYAPCDFLGIKYLEPEEITGALDSDTMMTVGHTTTAIISGKNNNASSLEWGIPEPCDECGLKGVKRKVLPFKCTFRIEILSGYYPFSRPNGTRTIWDHEIHAHVQNFITSIKRMRSFIEQVGNICSPLECEKFRNQSLLSMMSALSWEERAHGALYDSEDYPPPMNARMSEMRNRYLDYRWDSERKSDEAGREFSNCYLNAIKQLQFQQEVFP